jgi:hypothetical protein
MPDTSKPPNPYTKTNHPGRSVLSINKRHRFGLNPSDPVCQTALSCPEAHPPLPIRNSLAMQNVSLQYLFTRTHKPRISFAKQVGKRIQADPGKKGGVIERISPPAPENHSTSQDLHLKGFFWKYFGLFY